MTTAKLPIVQVVLGLPKKNKDLITCAKAIIDGLTNNASFPAPNPSVAVLTLDVTALDNAETATRGGSTVATTQRNALKAQVIQDLKHERDYVQGVAEKLTTNVAAVVETSGFRLKKPGSRTKQLLSVKYGGVSGSVIVVAKAAARTATYYWEYSLDQKTWTSAPDTMKATVTIGGLTVGQTYAFRVRSMTRAGTSDYSQPVTCFVH
jgi:hypothetical protein